MLILSASIDLRKKLLINLPEFHAVFNPENEIADACTVISRRYPSCRHSRIGWICWQLGDNLIKTQSREITPY
jgi:hypothetical protein